MQNIITLGGGESAVTISGLSNTANIRQAAFDGITVTLSGAEVDNFGDLVLSGGARRIIWSGKAGGIERESVLIVDTLSGSIKGSWVIDDGELTYFDEEEPKITLQFVDKETALKPRTFTYMAEHKLLSLGSAFDHVTISAHDDVYLSRSSGRIISGVIKGSSKAQVDGGVWSFENDDSFAVETTEGAVKFYDGRCL